MAEPGALDRLLALGDPVAGGEKFLIALADASAAFARLDQAVTSHPLAPAFLHRARLDAVRRQAAVDGTLIDPWQLAALLEGLRLRMDPYLSIAERGRIFEAARTALALNQWIVAPDFDQEGEVRRAQALLDAQPNTLPPLLAGALGFRAWIEAGGQRAPIRAALIRFWTHQHLLRMPVPLTAAASLRAEQSWQPEAWIPAFLNALAREAADGLDLLMVLERSWFTARRAVAGRRKTSHAAAAVDVLAAAPVISATTLARLLGISVKTAIGLLDQLLAVGIAVEVTHRAKRRLFGLAGLTPLRAVVRPPYRPEPGRGPGRPRREPDADQPAPPALPLTPLSPVERREFDYTALDETMARLEEVVRQAQRNLATLTAAGRQGSDDDPVPGSP